MNTKENYLHKKTPKRWRLINLNKQKKLEVQSKSNINLKSVLISIIVI
jgi:hypothetical protein